MVAMRMGAFSGGWEGGRGDDEGGVHINEDNIIGRCVQADGMEHVGLYSPHLVSFELS